ncbi:MAG: YeeE/YedE family protein, partial [Phycisphaerales bacterium]|nr:YeeE/YedE family protein [Phycisphaerales bacterium]
AVRNRTSARMLVGGTAIGGVVALTWGLTSTLSQHTFEPTQVESISFTGPAAHVISFIWSSGAQAPSFDTGFIPAVAIGAFAASLLFGEFRLQWFDGLWSAATYGAGAVLMGFGGAMAVGCAVGNLATAAVMITASWVAVAAIAAGAILALKAQRLLERGVMCLDGGAWSSGYPRFRPKYEDAASPAPAAINTAAMP